MYVITYETQTRTSEATPERTRPTIAGCPAVYDAIPASDVLRHQARGMNPDTAVLEPGSASPGRPSRLLLLQHTPAIYPHPPAICRARPRFAARE